MKKTNKKSYIPQKREKPKNNATPLPNQEEQENGIRLNKYIAHCGICSRRKAAEYIEQGNVKVNGQTVLEIGHRVLEGDIVSFKGNPVRPEEKKIYLLMNKPKDVITTVKDDRGRKTVMDLIGNKVTQRLFPVGRLDRATTGLLLLTNDGDLAKKLSHPSYEVKKVYHVTLDKDVTEEHLKMISKGLQLDDGVATVDGVSHVKGKSKYEVGIELHIGRNRIVRRIFEFLGYKVKRLDRVYYAGLTKKDLPRGHFRFLNEKEIIMLKHFV